MKLQPSTYLKKLSRCTLLALLTIVGGTAYAAPSTFTVTAFNAGPYCQGDVANITIAYVGGGTTGNFGFGNVFTVELSTAAGTFPGTVISTTGANTARNGSVTVSVTIPAGASGTGYRMRLKSSSPSLSSTNNNNSNIIINADPTVAAGGAMAAICQNVTSDALAGSFSGTGTSAVWSASSGTFSNNTGTTPNTATYTPGASAGTITLTLTASSAAGCTNSTTKNITVNTLPTVNAGAAMAAICANGTSAALGGVFGGSAASAVWSASTGSFSNNTGSTPNTATYTASATTGSITLTLTTAGGSCGTTHTSKVITVNPSVATPVFSLGTASTRCQGGTTVTYTATAANNTGISYALDAASLAGGNSINSTNGAVTFDVSWNGTSTITAFAAGCSGPKNTDHVVTITPAPNTSMVPTSNNMLDYEFTNGNLNDLLGSNDAVLQGAPVDTTDRYGDPNSAYILNGTSQYITSTTSFNNPINFTVSLWFKTAAAYNKGGLMIGFDDTKTGASTMYDRHIYMLNSGQLNFGIYLTGQKVITSANSYNDGSWHLATATFSNTTGMALYVDGTMVASDPGTVSSTSFTGWWRIGYSNSITEWAGAPASDYFQGSVDDVVIYNTAISSAEVQTIYSSPDGAGSNSPICAGSVLSLTGKTLANSTYAWSGPNGFSSALQNPTVINAATSTQAGKYTLIVTNTSTNCISNAFANVIVNSVPPAISSHPASQSKCVGAPVTFSVTATPSTSITYQWQKNGVDIYGAVASSYTIAAAVAGDAGSYRVIVSNYGCDLTSNAAVLTVVSPVTIAITGPANFCRPNSGTSVKVYTATAVSGAASYTWAYSGTGASVSGTTVTGNITMGTAATSGNVTVSTVGAACANTGTLAVVSSTGVPSAAGAITGTSPVCQGQTAVNYNVGAIVGAITYTWSYAPAGPTINGNNATNAVTIDYPVSAVSGNVSVVGVNACGSGATGTAKAVTVNALPIVNAVSPVPICSGSATNIALVSTPAGATFTWAAPVSAAVGAVTGGSAASGAAGPIAQNLSNVTASAGTLTYTVFATRSGCAGTVSTQITQSVHPSVANQVTWTGAISTDWATANNWVCGGGVPTITLDAVIPTGLSNYPLISTTPANARGINIANGASLTVAAGAAKTLNVYGNWVNNGTFTPDTSTVVLTGATATAISGADTTNFYHLRQNKTSAAAVTINGVVTLTGKLSFGTSAVNTLAIGTGSFIFLSTANSTAHIDQLSTVTKPIFSGNFICQKYLPAQTGRYNFMLGAPVTTTASDLLPTTFDASNKPKDGLYLTGTFTGASSGNGLSAKAYSAFTYDPAVGLYVGYPATNITAPITPGTAYRISVRDNGTALTTVAKTITLSGTLAPAGNFTFTGLQYAGNTKPFNSAALPTATTAGGWNLVGNPYMSDINLNLTTAANWTASNINPTVYIYNAKTRSYTTCASGVGACILPAFQAFFVKSIGAPGVPTLIIKETAKVTSTNNAALNRVAQSNVLNYLEIALSSSASENVNKTYIRYTNGAAIGADDMDGFKLGATARSYIADIAVFSRGKDKNFYDVNAKPYEFATDTTELLVVAPAGNATLDFSKMNNLESGYTISLYDRVTKKLTGINANPVYKFVVTADSNSFGPRFQVIFNRKAVITTAIDNIVSGPVLDVYPNPTIASNVRLSIENYSGSMEIEVFDLLGNLVYITQTKVDNKSDMLLSLPSNLAPGVYTVDIDGDHNLSHSEKLIIK